MRRGIILLFLLLLCAGDVAAQHVNRPFEQDTTVDVRSPWRPLRIAKWTTFLASGGAAAFGFVQNRRADREYEQLESECLAEPANCSVLEDGSYANAVLEDRYQRIVDRDRTARTALLAGQIGLAASVIMFIIDLPERETPEDIPYEPRPLRVGLRSDGRTEFKAHISVPSF